MMIGFGILVIVICGIILWQFIHKYDDANALPKEKRKGMPQSAQDILDERYANDELTREEYLAMVEDIEAHRQYE